MHATHNTRVLQVGIDSDVLWALQPTVYNLIILIAKKLFYLLMLF
jgi:hypothetical protein